MGKPDGELTFRQKVYHPFMMDLLTMTVLTWLKNKFTWRTNEKRCYKSVKSFNYWPMAVLNGK